MAGRSGGARVQRELRVFAKNERGSTAMIAALGALLLAGAVGGAVDFARVYSARSQAQAALDAAVLAGARKLQTSNDQVTAVTAATTHFGKLRPAETSGSGASFSVHNNGTVVRGSVSTTIVTPFLTLVGFQTLPIELLSEVGFAGGRNAGTNYEIALMLDVTGSMCDNSEGPCTSGSKLNALKTAAADLVNIVVWEDQSRYTSKVALVPFSTRVRVGQNGDGANMMRELTDLPPTWSGWYNMCVESSGGGGSEGGGNWSCRRYESQRQNGWKIMPCVTDRTGPQEFTDAPPGPGTWINAHDGTRRMESWDSGDNPLTTRLGETSSDPADHWNYAPWDGGGVCADIANANEILPLTNDKTELLARINGLEAYGSTSGALGTAFTWYMLSPNWSGIWNGNSRPGPYADLTTLENGVPRLRKVAVLMSDGDFNTFRGWKDQNQSMVSNRAAQICTNMKATGIEVYAIGFGLDQLPADKRAIAEATLRGCGTDVSHFYNTFNASELQQAFRDIALQISTMHIRR